MPKLPMTKDDFVAMRLAMVPSCPWCRQTFADWGLAKRHVKFCDKAPNPRGKSMQKRLAVQRRAGGRRKHNKKRPLAG